MNKVLLINLKNAEDTLGIGGLINSIKKNDPSAKISVLIYKEYKLAISYLKNIATVHQVDRKKILSIKSSPLFSDTFAFNEFMAPLIELKKNKWDHVINMDNDSVSHLITSYLMNQKHSGICFKKDKVINYSNYWAKIYCHVLPAPFNIGLSSVENLHQMAQLNWEKPGIKIYLPPENNRAITKKIAIVKKQQSHISPGFKLVGVLIRPSSLMKEITLSTLCDFFHLCLENGDFHPLILISPSESEKKLANKLRELFSDHLTFMEYNVQTLPNILLHLDLLIAPDTVMKHAAGLNGNTNG